jgi:hypothetical protein
MLEVISYSRIIQEIGRTQKIPISDAVGSLQMMAVKLTEQKIQYIGNRCIGSWSASPTSVEA